MQQKLEIKIKKTHPDSVLPSYATQGDAGMDLPAISVKYDEVNDCIVYDTGLALEIPQGFVGLVYPRSSICKKNLLLTNSVGVIDSGYRGSITFNFKIDSDYFKTEEDKDEFKAGLQRGEFSYHHTADDFYNKVISARDIYKPGDRIGQLIIMPYPKIEFKEVLELSETKRGVGGYGSTGS